MAENKELAKPPIGMDDGRLTVNDFESTWRLAQVYGSSSLCPKDYQNNPGNIVVAWDFGAQIGLGRGQSLASIAVINGRACLWGDAMIGLVQASGLLESHSETLEGEGESLTAVCSVKRRGEPTVHTVPFSVADAKKAGLWGKTGPWSSYPKRMLQLRARGYALRDKFADVLKGLQLAEEQRDIVETTAVSIPETVSLTRTAPAALPEASTPDPMLGESDKALDEIQTLLGSK
jgi:hypothetical protein